MINISGQTARLCWGTLLMIREHSILFLQTECTWYKKIAMPSSGSMSQQKRFLQMTLPEVWILKISSILIDGFWSKILVEVTVIMGDKFGSKIIAIIRSRIEETSKNKQNCCWRWHLRKHWRKIFMLVDDETNNSTGAEMQNQHKTERGDDANKIK